MGMPKDSRPAHTTTPAQQADIQALPAAPRDARLRGPRPPDTALLYSVDDIALLAQVGRVFVVRLCLADELPGWISVHGRRYWDRRSAKAAVSRCRKIARERARTRRCA